MMFTELSEDRLIYWEFSWWVKNMLSSLIRLVRSVTVTLLAM